jgi:hypothetical protein
MGPRNSAVRRLRKSCEGVGVERGAELGEAASNISVEELSISSSNVAVSATEESERWAEKEGSDAATAGGVGRGRRSGVVGLGSADCSRFILSCLVSLKRLPMSWGRCCAFLARSSSLRISDVGGWPLTRMRKKRALGPPREYCTVCKSSPAPNSHGSRHVTSKSISFWCSPRILEMSVKSHQKPFAESGAASFTAARIVRFMDPDHEKR